MWAAELFLAQPAHEQQAFLRVVLKSASGSVASYGPSSKVRFKIYDFRTS
jgi:hypothetical protein